jgi:hypothetical protein
MVHQPWSISGPQECRTAIWPVQIIDGVTPGEASLLLGCRTYVRYPTKQQATMPWARMPTVHENDIPKGYSTSKNYNSNWNDNVPRTTPKDLSQTTSIFRPTKDRRNIPKAALPSAIPRSSQLSRERAYITVAAREKGEIG